VTAIRELPRLTRTGGPPIIVFPDIPIDRSRNQRGGRSVVAVPLFSARFPRQIQLRARHLIEPCDVVEEISVSIGSGRARLPRPRPIRRTSGASQRMRSMDPAVGRGGALRAFHPRADASPTAPAARLSRHHHRRQVMAGIRGNRTAEAITRHGADSPNARARVDRVPYLLAVADRVEQRLATGQPGQATGR